MTWGVSSTALFFSHPWTASNGNLYSDPGNYVLDTATGTVSTAAPDTLGTNDGRMHFTIGYGQIAGTIDFAFDSDTGIRIVEVWNINADGALTAMAVPGMENGPLIGFNAAFDLSSHGIVPTPAAAWLFGIGIIGLMGLLRRTN